MRSTSSPAMRPASRVAWALRVVEVRRHRDDRARRVPGPLADFLEDERGQFFRRPLAPADGDMQHLAAVGGLALDDLVRDEFEFFLEVRERAAHEPLHAEDGVPRVGERSFAALADEDGAVVVEADTTRHEPRAGGVAHDDRPPVLDERREAEGGSQVDPDNGRSSHTFAV